MRKLSKKSKFDIYNVFLFIFVTEISFKIAFILTMFFVGIVKGEVKFVGEEFEFFFSNSSLFEIWTAMVISLVIIDAPIFFIDRTMKNKLRQARLRELKEQGIKALEINDIVYVVCPSNAIVGVEITDICPTSEGRVYIYGYSENKAFTNGKSYIINEDAFLTEEEALQSVAQRLIKKESEESKNEEKENKN